MPEFGRRQGKRPVVGRRGCGGALTEVGDLDPSGPTGFTCKAKLVSQAGSFIRTGMRFALAGLTSRNGGDAGLVAAP